MSVKTDNFVFMKVGMHAGESFDSILARKAEELKIAGKSFWGYGGSSCHPLTQVRPFAKSVVEKGGKIHILMEAIDSKADPDLLPATEYSEDGVIWQPIPEGITVTGSRYAIVLGDLTAQDFEIPLDTYEVAIGRSAGRTADAYIRGRVDKACLTTSSRAPAGGRKAKIGFSAEICDPYAVVLRGGSAPRER